MIPALLPGPCACDLTRFSALFRDDDDRGRTASLLPGGQKG